MGTGHMGQERGEEYGGGRRQRKSRASREIGKMEEGEPHKLDLFKNNLMVPDMIC